jgi:hypothetical protein
MRFHRIEVDDEVWSFLKKHAEPFEDTPNSVLRRILLPESNKSLAEPIKATVETDMPKLAIGVPRALSQFLEVIYRVRRMGQDRREATRNVAKKEGVFYQTIIDKYCRQLGKKAFEIDQLLELDKMHELQSLLEKKFSGHRDVIRQFLKSLT